MTTAANVNAQQSAFQRNNRKQQGLFTFNGHIDAPANQDYVLTLFFTVVASIQFGLFKLSGGTCTGNLQIGVDVSTLVPITGFGAIAITSALQTINFTSTDGTNIAPIANIMVLSITAGAAPLNLDFTIGYLRL